jgi:hypothetical protein
MEEAETKKHRNSKDESQPRYKRAHWSTQVASIHPCRESKKLQASDSNLELCRAQRLTSIAPAREGARPTRK